MAGWDIRQVAGVRRFEATFPNGTVASTYVRLSDGSATEVVKTESDWEQAVHKHLFRRSHHCRTGQKPI